MTLIAPLARDNRKLEDWQSLYRRSAQVDSLAPQRATAFYMSYAAFKIAEAILATIPDLAKADQPRACAQLTLASDYIAVVDLKLSRGSYDWPAGPNMVDTIRTQMKPYITSTKTRLACR